MFGTCGGGSGHRYLLGISEPTKLKDSSRAYVRKAMLACIKDTVMLILIAEIGDREAENLSRRDKDPRPLSRRHSPAKWAQEGGYQLIKIQYIDSYAGGGAGASLRFSPISKSLDPWNSLISFVDSLVRSREKPRLCQFPLSHDINVPRPLYPYPCCLFSIVTLNNHYLMGRHFPGVVAGKADFHISG